MLIESMLVTLLLGAPCPADCPLIDVPVRADVVARVACRRPVLAAARTPVRSALVTACRLHAWRIDRRPVLRSLQVVIRPRPCWRR